MYDVTALGELLIDFTDSGTSPAGQKVFERNPGGAPANVLVALQRLGHSTAFVGKVGCDMHGAFLRQTLEENDVDCSGLASDPDYFTTLASVALDPTGERTFSFARKPGADTQLRADEPNRDVLQNTRGLHVGSLSLTDEPARSATLEALRIARDAGAILSHDPNYRASLWPSAEVAAQQMRSVVGMMDLVKISAEETTLLTDESDPNKAARKILAQGPRVVVVTLDADGAMVVTPEGAHGAELPRERDGRHRRRRLVLGRLPVRAARLRQGRQRAHAGRRGLFRALRQRRRLPLRAGKGRHTRHAIARRGRGGARGERLAQRLARRTAPPPAPCFTYTPSGREGQGHVLLARLLCAGPLLANRVPVMFGFVT